MRIKSVAQTDDNVTVSIPRSALTVVVPARTMSQRTTESVTGVPAPHYLHLLPEFREAGGDVISVGKLRIVEVEPFVAWLRRRSAPVALTKAPAVAIALTERDALEAELGLVGAL